MRDLYKRTVYGVGYIEEGNYTVSKKGKHTPQYEKWKHMLQRCYSEISKIKYPTYKDCTVTEKWHNFQNFGVWYDENYYEIENGHVMCLDKDILIKGNKVYSPGACIFVPQNINSLFTKRGIHRGELPIGVRKKNSSFEARSTDGKGYHVFLGCFKTPEEAFEKYKIYKEELIKNIANEYKNKIPLKLYNAMINYKVEIND